MNMDIIVPIGLYLESIYHKVFTSMTVMIIKFKMRKEENVLKEDITQLF
jgi:hypothetical protein